MDVPPVLDQSHRDSELSPNQRLLWHMARVRPDLGALNCPVVVRLRGRLDDAALHEAIGALVARHDALRTTFAGSGRRVRQTVAAPGHAAALDLTTLDVSAEADPEGTVRVQLSAELATPVELDRAPLRVRLWRLGPTEHVLCLTIHHLVTDAWSTGVLLDDLAAAYGARLGVAREPAPDPGSFLDLQVHDDGSAAGAALARHRDYWVQRLGGAALPDVPRGQAAARGGVQTGVVARTVPPQIARGVARPAGTARTTPFAVGLAAFAETMHRVSGQSDVTVASMFANRLDPRSHPVVGFLANMVLLRTQRPVGGTGLDLIRAAHGTVTSALAHQSFPFHLLPPGTIDASAGRADDVVFQFMTDVGSSRVVGDLVLEPVLPEQIGSRFGLELAVARVQDGYRVVLFYRQDWTDQAWADRFVDGFTDALALLVTRPDDRLPG